ncbi:cytochrome b-large subunit [Fusarium beomiforme]|uniref:Cytochrome b-large subunit n=1 Tax=Fusarium beomiforme TaxID=44412 RepID=A0A9P5AT86_9HYPO|nr:cytochrome b-large subunit [Fusarium beomiforme]
MNVQRVGLGAMRGRPGVFFNKNAPKLALARLLSQQTQARQEIVHLNEKEGHEILVKQRLNRPVTPNLTIYKLGQVWFSASAWTRITGLAVGGTAYLTLCAYAVAPYFGMGFDWAALVSTFGPLPFVAKAAVKFGLLGFPFTYHFVSGIRHLVFDLGFGYKKARFKESEAATWTLSILGGLLLAFWI